ncbi:hypothetical protein DASC09_038900 [Saccharomycopsis crataegensis]|uniref:Ribosome biogenesis protein SLX9 n=1 Tax=Saccharomycopsis crataegensis TaxID=43959 RepID=A0AAV5QNS0_9ASCO|nr:hypothetical protein DASC09_038900 [Saccharomycopsis crataegensis]
MPNLKARPAKRKLSVFQDQKSEKLPKTKPNPIKRKKNALNEVVDRNAKETKRSSQVNEGYKIPSILASDINKPVEPLKVKKTVGKNKSAMISSETSRACTSNDRNDNDIFTKDVMKEIRSITPFTNVVLDKGVILVASNLNTEGHNYKKYDTELAALANFLLSDEPLGVEQSIALEFLSKNKNFSDTLDVLVEKIKANNKRTLEKMSCSGSQASINTVNAKNGKVIKQLPILTSTQANQSSSFVTLEN